MDEEIVPSSGDDIPLEEQQKINISEHIGLIWTMLQERNLTQDDDALQEAYLGVCEATNNFNKELKVPFGHYAGIYIKKNLIRLQLRNGTQLYIPKVAFQRRGTIEAAKKAKSVTYYNLDEGKSGYESDPESYRFSDLLKGLDEYESEIITLRILHSKSIQDIAIHFHTNKTKILTDYARAKRRLKRKLSNRE